MSGPIPFRVLELSDREGAAAYCGKLFARWGSDVIKVESPERPTAARSRDLYLNGGKRRVPLDFRTSEGYAQLEALAQGCEVLVTDHCARDVREHQLVTLGAPSDPGVRVAITPYGLTGPYADFEATNASLLAMGGYTTLMGDPDREPLTLPGNYPLYQAGSYAYTAAVASALRARRDPGSELMEIDISVFEVLASLHQNTYTKWLDTGVVRARVGNRMDAAPNTFLPVKDGWVGISLQQQFWYAFAHMIGRPDIAENHVLASNIGRLEHYDDLLRLSRDAFAERSATDLFEEAQGAWRVPIGKLLGIGEMLTDPHLAAREFWRPVEGAEGEDAHLRTPGSGFRFVGEPPPPERVPEPPGSSSDVEQAKVAPAPTPRSGPLLRPARPLEGVRVLDLTRVWSGPVAGRILGDLGAEVIAVEEALGRGPAHVPPDTPGYARHDSSDPWNYRSVFTQLHRNRLSLCVDLKRAEGREVFLRLVAVSDVVLENFSARAMSRLGLGYEALRNANQRIVYVPMPAFGRSGRYRDYIGYGSSIEPLAGLPELMGYPGGPPHTASIALPDPIAGLAAATAVVTALERRERTGQGAEIDLSQHEGAIGAIGEYVLEVQLSGEEPARLGNWHAEFAPHGIYPCAEEDAWVQLAARDEREWRILDGLASMRWAVDPRFATAETRREHRQELDAAIAAWTAGHDQLELVHRLLAAGLPAGGVLTAPQLFADPHLRARGYFAELHHPVTGRQRFDGSPLIFNGDRGYADWRPSPMLGEDNAQILRDFLGCNEAEIERLTEAGVLATRPPE